MHTDAHRLSAKRQNVGRAHYGLVVCSARVIQCQPRQAYFGTAPARPGRHGPLMVLLLLVLPLWSHAQVTTVSEAAHNQFVLAYRLLQRDQDRDAAAAFDQYLGEFPNDEKRADALYFRALLAMRAGRRDAALIHLAKAGRAQIVPDHALRLLRGQLHTDLGQYTQALAALEPIDADLLDPVVRASVLHLRGVAYRGANNLPAASAQLTAAAQIESPLRARAMLDQGRILAMMGKLNEAIEVLQGCVALNQQDITAEAARIGGDLAYQADQFDRAIAFYGVVLRGHQTSPHFGAAVRGAMWAHYSATDFEATLNLFEQHRTTLVRAEDRLGSWYLAGSALRGLGRHEQAAATFEQIRADAFGWKLLDHLLYKLALSRFEQGQFDAMTATLAVLKAQQPDSPLHAHGAFLLAAADAKRGQTVQAAARLTAIIDSGPTHPYFGHALIERAQLHESSNDLSHAVADYEAFVNADVSVKGTTRVDVVQRLVDLHYRQDQYDKSLQAALSLLPGSADAQPRPPLIEQDALYRAALAMIKLQRYDEALASIQRLLERHPLNKYAVEARYYQALVLIALQRPDEAMADLEHVAASDVADPSLRRHALRLSAIHLRQQDRSEEAMQALARLEQDTGDLTAEERLWLGRHHVQQNNHAGAAKYLEPLLDKDSKLPRPQRSEALYWIALCRRAEGRHDVAVRLLNDVVAMGGDFELEARLELGRSLADAGRFGDARNAYEGLVNQTPTRIAVQALLGQARVHRSLADQRRREGDALGSAENLDAARSALTRIILLHDDPRLSPLPQIAHLQLHDVLAGMGDTEAARQGVRDNLGDLIEKYPHSPHAEYARALIALTAGDRDGAARVFKRLAAGSLETVLAEHVQSRLKELEAAP